LATGLDEGAPRWTVGSSIIRSPLAELAVPLRTYADAIGLGNSKPVTVERIIPHILERFIRTDRASMRMRRHVAHTAERSEQSAAVEPDRAALSRQL
jgi:hypothetical protein